jgi:RimJ/RimL family protein N-acetyltransferase
VRQIVLGANAANPAAVKLYQSLGFEAFGLERGFMLIDGQLYDEIHMVRILDQSSGG